MLYRVAFCNARNLLYRLSGLILIIQKIRFCFFNLICEHNKRMSCCFIKVFGYYSRMSNMPGLYHNHIIRAEPFVFLQIIKFIIDEDFSVSVDLAVLDIVRFQIKMPILNIVRRRSSNKCISYISVN